MNAPRHGHQRRDESLDYAGFGNCPAGVPGFCVNDDIALVTIPAGSAPSTAKIYKIATNTLSTGAVFTQVGYGTSGTGTAGYTISPSFSVKRSGKNVYDLFDNDDESNFSSSSAREVWYADFDGPTSATDTFCNPAIVSPPVCGGTLGNSIEDTIGGGDSGGPSFIQDALGNYILAANDTFSETFFAGQVGGTFGTALRRHPAEQLRTVAPFATGRRDVRAGAGIDRAARTGRRGTRTQPSPQVEVSTRRW